MGGSKTYVLDFRPDIVCDIRDWWMIQHEADSAFKPYYHWMIMPAVDCDPLREDYINMLLNADSVFAYSEYGKGIIEESTKGLGLKVSNICSPAASAIFSPVDNKEQHKRVYRVYGRYKNYRNDYEKSET